MKHKLSERSLSRLNGVHPDLVRLIKAASVNAPVDFQITEGLRSYERQRRLVKAGASGTMNSRHLTGHAVDVVCLVDDKVRWDWPLYEKLAEHVKKKAREMNIRITWGGDWRKLRDGPHYELSRKHYK